MRTNLPLLLALATAFVLAGCFDDGTGGVQKSRADDAPTSTTASAQADPASSEGGDGGSDGSTGGSGDGGAPPPATTQPPATTSPPPVAPPAPPESVPAPEVHLAFTILPPSAAPDAGNPPASKVAGFRIEPAEVSILAPAFVIGTVANELPADAPDQAPMNFTIPSLNVTVGPVKKGQTLSFEVRVDAAGEYEYFIDGPHEAADGYKALGFEGTLKAVAPEAS